MTNSTYHNTAMRRDRISELPDDLLLFVLKLLPLRDVIKSSVLSHRWNRACSTLTTLEFLRLNMLPTKTKCTEKIVSAINQYLKSFKGEHITRFAVSFRLGSDVTNDIDGWVSFAIRMGVEDLHLHFARFNKKSPPRREGKYVFKTDVIFSGAKINLKRLLLAGCVLGPNFTSQLTSLESLILVSLPLAQYDLQSIFSRLRNLTCLEFRRCTLPEELYVGSLHLLKSLRVLDCYGITDVKLSNANLVQLSCVSSHFIKLSLNGVVNLERYSHRNATGDQLHAIFSHHPEHLKTLIVSTTSVWAKHVPEDISIFNEVTMLKLGFRKRQNFDILKMISILAAFPSLRKFHLMMKCPTDVPRKRRELRKYVCKHLEEVEIGGFHTTPEQIKFAIFLLKHAFVLKRMVIRQKFKETSTPNVGNAWDEAERQKICEQLQDFSNHALVLVVN